MLISILVPIYGVEKFIARCAESLFAQTLLNNIEFIFVNDCTKDSSVEKLLEVLEKYPNRKSQVTILNHSKNRGLAASRQTALDNANGDYVLTVDSDDWLELDTCERIFSIAQKTNCDIVVYDHYANYTNKQYHCCQQVYSNGYECLQGLLMGKMHGGTCTKLIRRNLYFDNDIRYIEGLNMLEDISVVYRLFYYAKHIEYLNVPLYHYYQGNVNSYCTQISIQSKQNILQLIELMTVFFNEHHITEDISAAFECFKIRTGILLLMYSTSYKEYTNTIKRFDFKNFKHLNFLSKRDLLIRNSIVYLPLILSYYSLLFLNNIRKIKLKIYNTIRL